MSNVSDFIIENGVLTKYVGPGGDVVIPEGVFAIGYACFSENQDIKSVVIPEGVTEILTSAFADCPNLENATIAGSVVYLQNRSFAFCEKLKEVRMQEGIKHIGEEAFAHCTSLKKIVLPNSVKTMGNGGKMLYGGQFIGSGLEEITMPIGVEPSHGKNIVAAFAQCDNLRKITFTEGGCNDPQEQAVVHLSRKDSFRGKLPEVVYAPGCLIEKLGDLKEPAVLGYLEMLEAGTAIDAIIAEAYEKYIKAQKKKLYPLAIQNEKLLDHMIRKQLIPAADMEQLLEIAGAQGDTAVKALLLDYQSRSFSGKDMEQAKV